MFKRLFRIALILIILLWISKYSTILDNTKIKPYLVHVESLISNTTSGIRSRFVKDSSDKNDIESTNTWTQEWYGITWSASFSNEDIINWGNTWTMKNNDWIETMSDIEEVKDVLTGTKKIANLQIKNCVSPWWKFVPKNNYIIAYEARSSNECKWEKRYCNNGSLDGSFQYDTCFYSSTVTKQQNNASLKKNEIEEMKKEYGLVENLSEIITINETNNEGKIAWPGKVVSSKSTEFNTVKTNTTSAYNANNLKSSYNDPEKHYLWNPEKSISIWENGQTEINNHKFKTRSLKKQVIWYQWEEFISNKYSLTAKNSYSRKLCITPWWSIISNGQFVTAWKRSVAENGVCELETRFCIDGSLQWNYSSASCKGDYPVIISHNQNVDKNENTQIMNYTESINIMKNTMIDLDPMPTPLANSTTVSSYEVFHQPDKVDSSWSPVFQFIPINNNGVYTESQIIIDPSYVIYHQPDER